MKNEPIINYYTWLKLNNSDSTVKELNIEFKKARQEVLKQLESAKFMDTLELKCDLGDIGNEIGIAIANYFSEETGFNQDTFIRGIKHGISLTDSK